MLSPQNNIRMTIREKIFVMIKNDLTIGRNDRDLEPYSDGEIRQFIIQNLNNIEEAIWAMIRDYEEDETTDELLNADSSMICEYLYEFVDTRSLD